MSPITPLRTLSGEGTHKPLSKATKILLVDDEPIARSIPASFLRKWGYEVIEAKDGQQALEILAREAIGLVISDWVMPNVSGVELCRRIRAANFDHYTYLILCTSKAERSDLIEGMEAGADEFLVKPISREEIRVRVCAGERVLDLERGLAERNHDLNAINTRLQSAYEQIREDLNAAAWMQKNLLPSPAQTTLNVASAWRLRPSSYVAGDILNVFPLDDRHVGFYLLDVAGHGVPAAMLSVTLSMALRTGSMHGSLVHRYNSTSGLYEIAPPAEVVAQLNRSFQGNDDRYFTIVYGLIDTHKLELTLTQAGHPSPILMTKGEELKFLGDGGPLVGLWPDMQYEEIHSKFVPGDRLLLYSDGVTECCNAQGDALGDERLLSCLRGGRGESLANMVAGLEMAAERWRGRAEFDDDVSLLALEFTERSQEQR